MLKRKLVTWEKDYIFRWLSNTGFLMDYWQLDPIG